jgi:hypothetical protein
MTPTAAHDVAATWIAAAVATGPADRDRAQAAALAAYRAAGLPAPRRFVWCASLHDAVEQLRHHIAGGRTPLIRQVRRDVLNKALAAARAPLWQQASDLERFTAHRDFHCFFERAGYYGEQRYDGVEERYDLTEYPYRCSPVLPAERSALQPVLHAVRSSYDRVLRPTWDALGRAARDYDLHPAWYWYDHFSPVDHDDEARAVVQYCLPDLRDRFFDPAWHFYPDPQRNGAVGAGTPRGRPGLFASTLATPWIGRAVHGHFFQVSNLAMFCYAAVIDVTAATSVDCDGTASATGSETTPSPLRPGSVTCRSPSPMSPPARG